MSVWRQIYFIQIIVCTAMTKCTVYMFSSDAILVLCFFFFSSRRRHTICSRDWSSDVCSSDLGIAPAPPCEGGGRRCDSCRGRHFASVPQKPQDEFCKLVIVGASPTRGSNLW